MGISYGISIVNGSEWLTPWYFESPDDFRPTSPGPTFVRREAKLAKLGARHSGSWMGIITANTNHGDIISIHGIQLIYGNDINGGYYHGNHIP